MDSKSNWWEIEGMNNSYISSETNTGLSYESASTTEIQSIPQWHKEQQFYIFILFPHHHIYTLTVNFPKTHPAQLTRILKGQSVSYANAHQWSFHVHRDYDHEK